jgi:hypothetical protein
MSAALRPCLLSPELLAFRDFRRDPPGVWLWPGGLEPFARVSAETYRLLAASDIAAGVSAARLEMPMPSTSTPSAWPRRWASSPIAVSRRRQRSSDTPGWRCLR